MGSILHQNHVSLTSVNEINRICKPLCYLGIDTFIYIKNYKDRQIIHLSNDSQWLLHYYKKKFYKTDPLMSNHSLCFSGFLLWPTLEGRDISYDASVDFNMAHVIVLAEKCKNKAEEYYLFGYSNDKRSFINHCINNLALLKKFVLYFKNRASLILKVADKNRIILPNDTIGTYNNKSIALNTDVDFSGIKRKYFRETKISKYCFQFSESGSIYLSGRELDVIFYFLQNKTASEISKAVNLSRRTVEGHLSRIKIKLCCNSREELRQKLLNSGFMGY